MLLFRVDGGRLGGLVKGPQCVVPDAIEVGPYRTQPFGVELVDPPRALGAADDEPAVLEHAKMLGYRRAADRQLPGQLPDRVRAPGQQLEDRPPGRVADQAQTGIFVSYHERLV